MTETDLEALFTERICALAADGLPAALRGHALDLIANGLAVAIDASREPAAEAVMRHGSDVGGRPTSPVPGRAESLDPLFAAMAAATMMQITDFDDTHLETVIHPTATALAAVLAVGSAHGTDGQTALRAYVLGCEAQLRVGAAMPGHYEKGWHITSTCGMFGAAVAASVCLGLDAARTHQALAIAASQSTGHRSAFGTDVKPVQAGKAAANGVLSALLAADGFTGPRRCLTGPRAFFRVMAPTGYDDSRLLGGLGEDWELLRTTAKPYPCGVVTHPAIEAAERLARAGDIDPRQVTRVDVRCHPLVPELTGVPRPETALCARFSTAHAVAAALVTGAVTPDSYRDEIRRHPGVVRVRDRVTLSPDPGCRKEAASVTVSMADGRTLTSDVQACRGAPGNELTAAELDEKVCGLVEGVLPGRAAKFRAAVANLPAAVSLEDLGRSVSAAL